MKGKGTEVRGTNHQCRGEMEGGWGKSNKKQRGSDKDFEHYRRERMTKT